MNINYCQTNYLQVLDKDQIIKVDLIIREGIYIATSENLKGFLVAHANIFTFLTEIPEVIKAIYKANNKVVEVEQLPASESSIDCIKSIRYYIKEEKKVDYTITTNAEATNIILARDKGMGLSLKEQRRISDESNRIMREMSRKLCPQDYLIIPRIKC